MTTQAWLFAPPTDVPSAALAASVAACAQKLRTPPQLPADLSALIARHNATLQPAASAGAQAGNAGKSTGKGAVKGAQGTAAAQTAGKASGKTGSGALYRIINQDAQLSGAAAEANQKIQAILQQYQAKKAQAQQAQATPAAHESGPHFFLESAADIGYAEAASLLALCHQLNRTELVVPPSLDDLLQLNSVEGLYELPLWALRINLDALTECDDLSSLELMVLPQTKVKAAPATPSASYRGPLCVILKLNFAQTSLVQLTALEYDECAQVSCATLISELIAESDAQLLAQASGDSIEAWHERCDEQVVAPSLDNPALLTQSLLLAPYFKAGTTPEARLVALRRCACALGYVLTHLGAISVRNELTPLPQAGTITAPVTFQQVAL